MDFALVVSGADISLGNNHTRLVHLQHNHGMGVIAYPQDISGFYVLI